MVLAETVTCIDTPVVTFVRSGGTAIVTNNVLDNLFIQSRSGLVLTDTYGNNGAILPSYLNKPTGDEYAYINDAGGALDANNDTGFTMCGWVKSETVSKVSGALFIGKYNF